MYNWNYPKRGEKRTTENIWDNICKKKKKKKIPNLMKSVNPDSRKLTNSQHKKKTTRHITIKLLKSSERNL